MASPFKRLGRAIDNLKGGMRHWRLGSAVLPAGMIQSSKPQQILAHPKTGQLILQGMTIQPKEGMYSVFSMDDVEILVRYSKVLAYRLPQAPAWKGTEMVYVSPKLDAFNLNMGASFTVFVGPVHYLVTVIERLPKAPPISPPVEHTCPPEELNSNTLDIADPRPDDQGRQLHSQFPLPPNVTAFQSYTAHRMDPTPQSNIERVRPTFTNPFQPIIGSENTLGQSASSKEPIPISPKTPNNNVLTHGSALNRIPLTPISPLDLKDGINHSKKENKHRPTTDGIAKQSPTTTMKSQRQKTSPSSKKASQHLFEHRVRMAEQPPIKSESRKTFPVPKRPQSLALSEHRPPTGIDRDNRTKPDSPGSRNEWFSSTTNASSYSNYGEVAIRAEADNSKTHSIATDGSYKSPSKGKTTYSKPPPKILPAQSSASSSRNPYLERERNETRMLKPKLKQPQSVSISEEHHDFRGHTKEQSWNPSQHSHIQRVPLKSQANPLSRQGSSPLPPLHDENDEIFVPDTIQRNVLPIGHGKPPEFGASASGWATPHLYSGVLSDDLPQKQRKGKERAIESSYAKKLRMDKLMKFGGEESDENKYCVRGSQRKLVLAFDIGTTYSGISYCILDPGQAPQIKGVTRFPAHEQISGASKIPTIIYYDPTGKVRAVGAEATREGVYEEAEEGHWVKTEWFKFHLRSKYGDDITEKIPPLPLNKTVVDVFSDFLRYLWECAKAYIQDVHANGPDLWESVEKNTQFVLSHPNGWEGPEQSQMRRAIVNAGLVPDTTGGHSRVSFVTEGEASLHFAVNSGVFTRALRNGEGAVIVDAGGGTIDLSTYIRLTPEKLSLAMSTFAEISIPRGYFHGSVFVTVRAREFIASTLEGSNFTGDLNHITSCFDKTTKLRFAKSDVAKFFQPSIDCITEAIQEQIKHSTATISHIVLVGGFAASDWLFNELRRSPSLHGLNILRPENHVNKAVSDGAISFFVDHFVTARVSRVVYGVKTRRRFDKENPEHQERAHKMYIDAAGQEKLREGFDVINVQIPESKEFRLKGFRTTGLEKRVAQKLSVDIWVYRGQLEKPRWLDVDATNFTRLCGVDAYVSHIPLEPLINKEGATYFRSPSFSVLLSFGLTEITASIAWDEDGVEKRTSAVIIYDQDM
ncbi:hypothetical protein M413DRAFT_13173 [Hebeloma cylindrosporum]|uniref:Uncharacterized protein n=1 Tax=Hebeloma cylindrosporum TaxID=76867 RepID=A0A0C3C287_HEBCY|nr:hypothetical protein M413DRAFT_13173 [Hebeloma cylindrosporum h7]